jgi:Ca-activated chloride channel family protein
MQRTRIRPLFSWAVAVAFSLATVPGSGANQASSASPDADQLLLNVCVREKSGAPILGLSQQDFSILIDKAQADIGYFNRRDEPESITLLVDVSGSMRSGRSSWRAAVHELSRIPSLSNPGSEFLVMIFNDRPKIVVDWTADRDILGREIAALEQTVPAGATALYDACVMAVSKSSQARNRKRFILLLTDGQDNVSRAQYLHTRRLLQESGVTVYCIGVEEPNDTLRQFGNSVMVEISSTTGGTSLFPIDPRQASHPIESVALWMRHGYQVGLSRASLPKDGKHHKITVSVASASSKKSGTQYVVTAPTGFWAPK